MSKKKKKLEDDVTLVFSSKPEDAEKLSKKKKGKKKKKKKDKSKELLSKITIKQSADSDGISYQDVLDSDEKVFFITPAPDAPHVADIGVMCVVKTASNSLVNIETGESLVSIANRYKIKDWRNGIIAYPSSIITRIVF